tara:strand:- start:344 stop:763 length:420 start_codon:yes stop_codon:yes gene_type:complete
MLNFFTTWSSALFVIPYLRKNESRSLMALTSCVALGGAGILVSNFKYNQWFWKEYEIKKWKYLVLEGIIHQLPFFYMINMESTGSAFKSIIPVTAYCTIVKNPYKVCGYKLKNYYGLVLVSIVSPIVHIITRNNNSNKT